MSKTIDGKYIFTHKGDDYVHLKDYVKLLNKIDKIIEYLDNLSFDGYCDGEYVIRDLFRILEGDIND